MNRPVLFLVTVLLLFSASPVWADRVHLRDGRTLVGAVDFEGPYVVVRHRLGTARVHRSSVTGVEDTQDDWDRLQQWRSELAHGTAHDRYRYGTLARLSGFQKEAEQAFLSVLRLDVDHAGARAALGYVRHEGHWITKADRNRLKGLVKYKGEWVEPAVKAEREEAARERAFARRRARVEAKRREDKARLARREARDKEDARLARRRAEEKARDAARRRVVVDRSSYYGGYSYDGGYGSYYGGLYDHLSPIYGPQGIAGNRTHNYYGTHRRARGHVTRGHVTRGHGTRGHVTRGHVTRGHVTRGHVSRFRH